MEARLNEEIPTHLSEKTRTALERLSGHQGALAENETLKTYPKNKTAAVLILLFEQGGILRVLLTTRSKSLRTHPGQTALPGGKCEPQDASVVDTALREAYEECGLDIKSPSLRYITTLPPFLSQWRLLVTPVVMFLEDPSIVANLSLSVEVDRIFSHPLEAILDPSLAEDEILSRKGTEDWPYEEELYNNSDSVWTQMRSSVYRMHRFRSSASTIKGLTADILILAAEIAFKRETTYVRYAPGQPTGLELVFWAIEDLAQGVASTTAVQINGLHSRIEESAK